MKHRHARSFKTRSGTTPIALTVAAGMAAGVSAVLALLAARVALVESGHLAASGWLGLVTPLAGALAGGLLAAALLYLFKVSKRDALLCVVVFAAAPAFVLGHLSRLFDPLAALTAGSQADHFSLAFWLGGTEWLAGAHAADVVTSAPGLRPAADLVGVEGCAALAMCELALVSGLLLAAVDRALSAPLCVSCRRWCRRHSGALRRSAAPPPGLVVARANARDWHFFRQLGPAQGRAALRFDLASCPSCDRMSALSIALTRQLRPDLQLVRDIRLGPDDLRTMRDLVASAPQRTSPHSGRTGQMPAFLPRS